MRTCHACQRELDEASLAAGRCGNCGTIVLKISQRTIDDRRLVPEHQESELCATANEVPSEESVEIDFNDTAAREPRSKCLRR